MMRKSTHQQWIVESAAAAYCCAINRLNLQGGMPYMSRLLIVVDRAKDWAPYYPSEDVLTFDEYLKFTAPANSRVRVINLCQSRSEEHTSELQSRENLVCRLLLEKKKKHYPNKINEES